MRGIGWMALSLLAALAAGALAFDKPTPGAGLVQRPAGGQAQDPALDGISGAYAFRTHCASCHGADGKGEGPLADSLRFHPADLTLIAKRHGGSFPTETVVRIVDGRQPLKGHGAPDMPIWGDAFKNADTGYDDKRVKEKIHSIVEYLKTLQVK
jgi:mono/diheme cytochrome c family protein